MPQVGSVEIIMVHMVCLQCAARLALAAACFVFGIACCRPPLAQSQQSSGTTTQSAAALHSFLADFAGGGVGAGVGVGEGVGEGVGPILGTSASLGSKRMTMVGSSRQLLQPAAKNSVKTTSGRSVWSICAAI